MTLPANIKTASSRMGERNDCSVKAIAIACNISYEEAHKLCAAHGRRNRRGMSTYEINRAIESLGFELKIVYHHWLTKFPQVKMNNGPKRNSFDARTITTLERELPGRGVFLVYTRSHVLTARAGKVHDWTSGRRHRIQEIYRVIKRSK